MDAAVKTKPAPSRTMQLATTRASRSSPTSSPYSFGTSRPSLLERSKSFASVRNELASCFADMDTIDKELSGSLRTG